jgi:chromosome segregation and condensation protein ScpB
MLASWINRRQRRPTLKQPVTPVTTATFLSLLILVSFILLGRMYFRVVE